MTSDADYVSILGLIKAALGRELGSDIILGLVQARQKLHDRMDDLGSLYTKGEINAVEYINQVNDATRSFKTTAKHFMGDLDFKQCFGDMKPHALAELIRRQDPSPS